MSADIVRLAAVPAALNPRRHLWRGELAAIADELTGLRAEMVEDGEFRAASEITAAVCRLALALERIGETPPAPPNAPTPRRPGGTAA